MRYENLGYSISVNIPNDYVVTAIIKQVDVQNNPEQHTLLLYLNRADIDILDKLGEFEILVNWSKAKWAATMEIAKKLESGYFNKYIERYEHHFKCSDIGNAILEELELKNRKPA